jgi:hypothetical protein
LKGTSKIDFQGNVVAYLCHPKMTAKFLFWFMKEMLVSFSETEIHQKEQILGLGKY